MLSKIVLPTDIDAISSKVDDEVAVDKIIVSFGIIVNGKWEKAVHNCVCPTGHTLQGILISDEKCKMDFQLGLFDFCRQSRRKRSVTQVQTVFLWSDRSRDNIGIIMGQYRTNKRITKAEPLGNQGVPLLL